MDPSHHDNGQLDDLDDGPQPDIDIDALQPSIQRGHSMVTWRQAGKGETNRLLAASHYLGPLNRCIFRFGMDIDGGLVAVQTWSKPTSRSLPSDGSWLELSRWCLTPAAGQNAGSRMHGQVVKFIRRSLPEVTTLVSYSDPSAGHGGSLYKACNWWWAPTWHRLRPPPTGNGKWNGVKAQHVKDRWVFPVRKDDDRAEYLRVKDDACVRLLAQVKDIT